MLSSCIFWGADSWFHHARRIATAILNIMGLLIVFTILWIAYQVCQSTITCRSGVEGMLYHMYGQLENLASYIPGLGLRVFVNY